MRTLTRAFSHLTEGVAALMMAAIFVTFILQIAVRYIVGASWFTDLFGPVVDASGFGWTLEFIMVLWLWTIFFGNAFIVRDRDHVTFDIIYFWARPTVRRWFVIVGSAAIMLALLASIEPTYSKMRILRLKSSATLPVKMLPIYSIYFLFLAVVGLRYGWRLVEAVRGRLPAEEQHHHLEITDE